MMRPAALFLSLVSSSLFAGELPQLTKEPWLGQYVAYQKRVFRFTVDAKGEGHLVPGDGKGGFINSKNGVKFVPLIEDSSKDGRTFAKPATADGWEAVTPASAETDKVTYRGTVAGGARFEVTFEFEGNEVRAGGRVIEKGSLTNPRLVIRAQVPNIYFFDKDEKQRAEKLKKDRIDLLRADGKKLKLDVLTPLDAETEAFSGPGISEARIEMEGFKGARFEISAGAGGMFELWNKGEAALYEGFSLGWKHNEEKDPEGKERCVFKLR